MKYVACFWSILNILVAFTEEPVLPSAVLKPTHFLSFTIPCYNCEATIEETLASVYQQSLTIPFEVICTDDGSTDHTWMILLECSKKYPNLWIYQHEYNQGGGVARNTCTAHSRGDLLFNLDSDNVLVSNSVQGLIDLIDRTGCDVATFGAARFFDGDFHEVSIWNYTAPSNPSNVIDFNNFINRQSPFASHQGNYLYTRKCFDLVGGYPEDCGAMDTCAFGTALLCTGCKMAVLPNTFYWHRTGLKSYFVRDNANFEKNLQRAISKFSAVFSDHFSEILTNPDRINEFLNIWPNLVPHVASKPILEHLFAAYALKKEGHDEEAKREFAIAMQLGCKSKKIQQYLENEAHENS